MKYHIFDAEKNRVVSEMDLTFPQTHDERLMIWYREYSHHTGFFADVLKIRKTTAWAKAKMYYHGINDIQSELNKYGR